MHSRLHIKFLFFLILFVSSAFGQRDSLAYVKSPYYSEPTPHFRLTQFKRGFSNDSLKMSLDSLENKPRNLWLRQDSLEFARISLETGNTRLSKYYFDHLKVSFKKEESYWYDYLMVFYLNKDFEGGIRKITMESPMIVEFSTIYFFQKIFRAQVNHQKDSKWYRENEVFNWEIDSSLMELKKDDPIFINDVIKPLRNLEFVLKRIISFVHEDDPILASACGEMGYIIQGQLNLTHAYIAYSLGRHYNKWDKDLLAELRDVKARLSQKNYKIPNFRKYFPRIEEWVFDSDMLKQDVIESKNDTTSYAFPSTMKPKEEPLIKFPHQFIVIGGLLIMIILLAIILKSKRK